MQQTARFTLPEDTWGANGRDSSDWRSIWVAAGIGGLDDWNRMRVVMVRETLWIIASTPASGGWLTSHIDAIAGVIADVVQDAVPLVIRSRSVGVRAGGEHLWAYRFPRIVVAKGTGDWKPHFAGTLDPALTARMTRMIESGLRRELLAWDRLPDELDGPFLVIADPGRPIIIPAIHADRSGHGKRVNVLARSQLMVFSPYRFEGDLFAGPLASIGFGRMLRSATATLLDRQTQCALLALPAYQKDSVL